MGKLTRFATRRANLEITTSEGLAAFARGNRETWSGTPVTVVEAEKVAAWEAGLRAISEDIGKLPFILYWKGDDRRRANGNEWWTVVHDRASKGWTSQAFREHMTYWAQHDGDSFALRVESTAQRVELIPFKRGLVTPERLDDGTMIYHVKERERPLRANQVFHLRGFARGHATGLNLYKSSREEIGLSLAMERHAGTVFKNGAQMGGVVEHPGEMSEKAYENLDRSLNDGDFSGENANRWLIVEEGAKAQPFSAENDKAQLIEGRKFQVTEHARRLRIPPHKVGDLENATFSNIEHQAIEYVTDSLLPWAIRWENAYNQQVITDRDVYAELLFDVLLRGDSKTRSEVYTAAILNGWMTPNEVRRRENMGPIAGGDVTYTPLNTATPDEREAKLTFQRAQAVRLLIQAGFDPDDARVAVKLPAMAYVGTQSATTPLPEDSEAEDRALAGV